MVGATAMGGKAMAGREAISLFNTGFLPRCTARLPPHVQHDPLPMYSTTSSPCTAPPSPCTSRPPPPSPPHVHHHTPTLPMPPHVQHDLPLMYSTIPSPRDVRNEMGGRCVPCELCPSYVQGQSAQGTHLPPISLGTSRGRSHNTSRAHDLLTLWYMQS